MFDLLRPCRPRNLHIPLLLLFAGLMASLSPRAFAEEIVIGQCIALSGALAPAGHDVASGVQVAIAQANAAGGIQGRRLHLIQTDDAYQPDKTVQCARSMINEHKAIALVGFAGTATVAALLERKVLADGEIPLIAPYTGGEALRKPFNPWIFHVRASYADETQQMVKQLVSAHTSRIAVLYQNDAFGQSGLAGVERALAERNLKIVGKGSYERGSSDLTQAVKDLNDAKPDAIIMFAVTAPMAEFIKKFDAHAKGVLLFSLSAINGQDLFKAAGDAARGTGITQVVPSPFSAVEKVRVAYTDALKKFAPDVAPSYSGMEGFIGANVLIEGLKKTKGELSRANLMKTLENLHTNIGGYKLDYTPEDHNGSSYVDTVYVGADGALLH